MKEKKINLSVNEAVYEQLINYLEREKLALRQCLITPTVSEKRKNIATTRLGVVKNILKELRVDDFERVK